MPVTRINGTELFYEEHGTGKQSILFTHGLCLSGRMYHQQVLALRERYRCITMDFRGQGRSAVAAGGYDIDTLARDAIGLMRKLDAVPSHFVGSSMGGFVGMRIALTNADYLRSLVLINTSADREEFDARLRYSALIAAVRLFGVRAASGAVMKRLFGKSFLHDPKRAAERERWQREVAELDRVGITRAAAAVVHRQSFAKVVGGITLPTLVIAGAEDIATPPFLAQKIHNEIEGSKHLLLSGAGHTACIEAPEEVTAALEEFLSAGPVMPA